MYGQVSSRMKLIPAFSLYLTIFILCIHLLALLVVVMLPLATALQLMGALFLAVNLIRHLRVHGWRNAPGAVTALEWDSAGRWQLHAPTGQVRSASLCSSSCVQPWLLCLNFLLDGGGRHSVVLLPDSADPEQLRRLRMRLRFIREHGPGRNGNKVQSMVDRDEA